MRRPNNDSRPSAITPWRFLQLAFKQHLIRSILITLAAGILFVILGQLWFHNAATSLHDGAVSTVGETFGSIITGLISYIFGATIFGSVLNIAIAPAEQSDSEETSLLTDERTELGLASTPNLERRSHYAQNNNTLETMYKLELVVKEIQEANEFIAFKNCYQHYRELEIELNINSQVLSQQVNFENTDLTISQLKDLALRRLKNNFSNWVITIYQNILQQLDQASFVDIPVVKQAFNKLNNSFNLPESLATPQDSEIFKFLLDIRIPFNFTGTNIKLDSVLLTDLKGIQKRVQQLIAERETQFSSQAQASDRINNPRGTTVYANAATLAESMNTVFNSNDSLAPIVPAASQNTLPNLGM